MQDDFFYGSESMIIRKNEDKQFMCLNVQMNSLTSNFILESTV